MPPVATATRVAERAVSAARGAMAAWSATSISDRLAVLRRFRHRVAEAPAELASTVDPSWRADPTVTLTAEVQPLLDACRFLEREAARILAPRSLGRRRRPLWLFGSRVELRRAPLGVVLVVGPANYPILLPGVQLLQALAAGNAVLVKPGAGGTAAMERLAAELVRAGLPDGLLHVLPEPVEHVNDAIDAGVDKLLLTGSVETGRKVLGRLAGSITPAVVELSGCDAVVVRRDADLDLAARAIAFGMTFNGGFTCIAPRRLLVDRAVAEELERRLAKLLATRSVMRPSADARAPMRALVDDAIARGARQVAPVLLADVPRDAPVLRSDIGGSLACIVPVDDDDDAAGLVAGCPFGLGASVFGSEPAASRLARRLDVGVAVVNDMIVPTADPRVPFGGRGLSGFGRTRGAEGLLELTAVRTTIVRRGRARPHLDPTGASDRPLFESFIRATHGRTFGERVRALIRVVSEARRRPR